MKQIPVGNSGKYAIVDDEDFDLVSQFTWRLMYGQYPVAHRRVRMVKDGWPATICMHRLILDLRRLPTHVDHINGNGLDNRRANLRLCTASQNACNRNRLPRQNPTSRYKGVTRTPYGWRAVIYLGGKRYHICYALTEVEAAIHYNVAAQLLHGEFARLNPV